MDNWSSIKDAALDLGVAERTVHRWVKNGKLVKVKTSDGVTYRLAESDVTSDVTMTSVTPGAASKNPGDPVAAVLTQEVRRERLELELEKIQDLRERSQLRRQEGEEELRLLREEGERARREDQEEAARVEAQRRRREIVAGRVAWAKRETCGPLVEFLPCWLIAECYLEIENELQGMDLLRVGQDEIELRARGARDRVLIRRRALLPPLIATLQRQAARFLVRECLIPALMEMARGLRQISESGGQESGEISKLLVDLESGIHSLRWSC